MQQVRYLIVILLISLLGAYSVGLAATRLGLHTTQEELTIWRSRMASGPYRVTGDVSTNSPGDWTRIAANAATFASSPSAEFWTGTELTLSGGCVANGSPALPEQNRNLGTNLMNAAFYIMVNSTASNRQTIAADLRTQLVNETTQTRLNFGNTSLWCSNPAGDANPFFDIAVWQIRMLFAYDYLKIAEDTGVVTAVLSAGDKTALDTWFLNGATFFQAIVQKTGVYLFSDIGSVANDALPVTFGPNATGTNGECNRSALNGGSNPALIYDGSPTVWNVQDFFSNRKATMMTLVANVGVMQNNTVLKNRSKQWIKMYVAYGTQADGSPTEMNRWLNTHPGLGWRYAMSIASYGELADVLARNGDATAYQYSTTTTLTGGSTCPISTATTKTLQTITTRMLNYADHTILRYIPGRSGQSSYVIDAADELVNELSVHDTYIAKANGFWKSAYVRGVYTRQGAGTQPYPANPVTSSSSPWTGGSGIYPGVLLMFGQMESLVNPHDLTGDTLAPKAPTSPAAAEDSSSQITLTWVAPTQNSDNSALTDLAGYRVTYCPGAGCTPSIDLPDVGLVLTLVHTGLQANTLYRYKVRARDTTGNLSVDSTIVQDTTDPLTSPWVGSISQSSDDAEQNVSTGSVNITGDDLEMVDTGTAIQLVAYFFANVQVPQGVTVTNAQIQFTAKTAGTPNSGSPALTLKVQAALNPTTFTTATSNVSSRTLRAESVAWSPASWTQGVANAASLSPNLNTLINPLVQDPLWVPGNAIVVIVSGASATRTADSYDTALGTQAVLTITWTGADTLAPKAPTGLQVTSNTDTTANLQWTAPILNTDDSPLTDLAGYKVYVCSTALCTPTVLRDTLVGLGTTYPVTTLTPETVYGYAVSAYDGNGNESAKSSTVYDTTDAGTPIPTGVIQAAAQCYYPDVPLGTRPKAEVNAPCIVASPSTIRLHTAVRNTDVTDEASTAHNLWCREGAGAWERLIDRDCTLFNLCYSDDALITSNQVITAHVLPLEGSSFATARAKRSSVPADSIVVPATGQVEYVHVLHVIKNLAAGTTFECCERLASEAELDSCTPATLTVGYPRRVNR